MHSPEDAPLELDPLVSLLPLDRPFTPLQAEAAGIGRAVLERLVRGGHVRRLLKGVYCSAGARDDARLRARALALGVGSQPVAVDRTACWLHGLDLGLFGLDEAPLDLARTVRRGRGSPRSLHPRDIDTLEGARLTSPLRTALDVGRVLRPRPAAAAIDRLLATGSFTHVDLLAELPRMAGLPGIGQLRVLAPQADARACCPPESILRLHWNEARLPTAIPAMTVVAGGRLVRLAIGTEHRRFGAVLLGHADADDLVALQGAGWWVVVLPEERVLAAEPETLTKHLEREYHQHLLHELDSAI